MMSLARQYVVAVALGAALAGCTAPVYEPPAQPRPVTQPAPAQPVPPVVQPEVAPPEPAPLPPAPIPPPPPPPPSSGATAALLEQSRSQSAAGNYPMATATLERALRINARDAEVWLELGRLKLRQGDDAQAESMGRRALSLAAGDAELRARCEALIAAAQRGG